MPKGYLKKPEYNRAAQERKNVLKKVSYTTLFGSAYKSFYFILDIKNLKFSWYKNDEPNATEIGFIDMSLITDIQYSQVYDAPGNSLDLITKDHHYTIQMENNNDLCRWCYALSLCQPKCMSKTHPRWSLIKGKSKFDIKYDKNSPEYSDTNQTDSSINNTSTSIATATNTTTTNNNNTLQRWYEYEIVYTNPNDPLMLNLVSIVNRDKDGKLLNYLLSIGSFEFPIDGSLPGVSENTGMISIKDYLIGVNDIDLTKHDISMAINSIENKTKWPKTLHFIRDEFGMKNTPKVEGWSFVKYKGIINTSTADFAETRKLRYIEFTYNTLHFFKAEPGGSVSDVKNTFFDITQIESMQCLVDELSGNYNGQQYVIILKCQPKSIMKYIGYETNNTTDNNNITMNNNMVCVGADYIDTIEFSFPTLRQLNRWRSAFASSFRRPDGTSFRIISSGLNVISAYAGLSTNNNTITTTTANNNVVNMNTTTTAAVPNRNGSIFQLVSGVSDML